jgi:HPt (histidine-containing phosphotransfer) domain-containing protein
MMADGAVDFDYLETFAAGDMQVVTEVLALFQGQAESWQPRLERPDAGWRDLAHTIKGSARGIGATALGEVADRAERGDASIAPELRAALADALAEIEGYLTRIGGG